MARPKFLQSKWFLYSLLSVGLLGGSIYWVSHLDKDTREDIRGLTFGLLLPGIIGGSGYWLDQQAEKRSGKKENEESEEPTLEDSLGDPIEDSPNAYQDYFDRISMLVAATELTDSYEESEQYQIARNLTANLLRELTEENTNQVISFLDSLSLLGRPMQTNVEDRGSDNQQPKRAVSLLKGIDLSKANLRGRNLRGASLRVGNFSQADLSGANLRETNLIGANLSETDLSQAKLNGANLIGANLSRANLRGTDLSGTNLRGADLSEVNLRGANMSGSNLSGTNLRETNLSGANLWDANLWEANLEKTKLSEHLTEEQQQQCLIYDPIIVELEG
jgi:uncharacterized protein YjbI with pentapeptide repeats